MDSIGIDLLHFYTPPFMVSLEELAVRRGVDPDKYTVGIGQQFMAQPSPDEDIVTMGAEAARPLLPHTDKSSIRLLLLATESGLDHSKSSGIWIHHLLDLPSSCRVVEVKQACYSATCALQLAISHVKTHPDQKVLVIASDVARYGLRSTGEPTQGAGAIALLVSAHPRLLHVEPGEGIDTSHVMDFWRPVYMNEALVDGKFSTKVYLETLERAWKEYTNITKRGWADHDRFCFHTPFCKMADKAYDRLYRINLPESSSSTQPKKLSSDSLYYAKHVGNCYTAALYMSLLSLLEKEESDLTQARIGCYSYGSGAVGEFFSCQVQPEYKAHLFTHEHEDLLSSRKQLSVPEYEELYRYALPQDGSEWTAPFLKTKGYRLTGLKNHIRTYSCLA